MKTIPIAKRRWNSAVTYKIFSRIEEFTFKDKIQLQELAENLFSQLPDELLEQYALREKTIPLTKQNP